AVGGGLRPQFRHGSESGTSPTRVRHRSVRSSPERTDSGQPVQQLSHASGRVDPVPITVGLPLAALICAALAVVGVAPLRRAPVSRLRTPYRLFAAGIGVGVLGLLGSAAVGGVGAAVRLGPFAVGHAVSVVLLLAGAGVAATAMTGLCRLVSTRYADGPVVLALGLGYAVSLGLTATALRRVGPAVQTEAGLPGSGILVALVPVGGVIIAAIIRMAVYGSTDNISILIATVIGSLIAVRQMLANSAARRYAHRLAEREAVFKEMAYTDALTGLGNRRQLMRVLYENAVGGPPCVLM